MKERRNEGRKEHGKEYEGKEGRKEYGKEYEGKKE